MTKDAVQAGLEALLAAIHADDPKRELLVRVGDLMRDVRALPAAQEWQDISTADRDKKVWLFTPAKRLGPNETEDEIRFGAPRHWTWATMWMPAQVPASPLFAEERGTK